MSSSEILLEKSKGAFTDQLRLACDIISQIFLLYRFGSLNKINRFETLFLSSCSTPKNTVYITNVVMIVINC